MPPSPPGFVLNVVEPHLNGPLGEVPALVLPAGADTPLVLCGQGVAPAGATVAHYRNEGLDVIPGSGLLSATNPGAFDAWMLMLRDHGRLPLPRCWRPRSTTPSTATRCSRRGQRHRGLADVFRQEWPTSAARLATGRSRARGGRAFSQPRPCRRCGGGWWRRVRPSGPDRDAQIEAARRAHAEGFVAEAIDTYLREACVLDATGERRKGVLTGQDMAEWKATWEAPLAVDHAGWTVWKCGAWTQGPVLLQLLQMLAGDDLGAMDPTGPDFVHLVTEALKRAFADREAYYGDPALFDIPGRYTAVGRAQRRPPRPDRRDGKP
jgi:gamma-glutamyltranspeptidase/glutathione hydrolase